VVFGMTFVPRASFAWKTYRRLVRTHTQFFSPPAVLPETDILKLCNLPVPFPGVPNESCPTIVIDLHMPEEDLWNGVEPKARKMIRHAIRENVQVGELQLSEEAWNAFLAAYWRLRNRKRNAGALGVGQIGELVETGRFTMTTSCDANGNTLSWHTYIRSADRVRLLNTVSAIDPARDSHWNNMVGRAHRLHHWRDMLHFKSEGIRTYDLGGVYCGTEDAEQLNIAKFKKSFGGKPAKTFDALLPLTVKGRIALSLVAMIGAEARAGSPGGAV